jgi:hypothetical protein
VSGAPVFLCLTARYARPVLKSWLCISRPSKQAGGKSSPSADTLATDDVGQNLEQQLLSKVLALALPGGACRSEWVGRHKRTLMRWPPADAQRVSLRAHLSQQAGRCQAYGAPAGLTPDEAALTVEQNVLTLERRRRGTVRATRRAESRCACARPSIARRRERGVLESRICP